MTALSLNHSQRARWGADDRIDPQARGIRPPSAAEQAARARARPVPLWQAVLLAALLHLWAALLFGSVAPGTAQPGQGVGGSLNIRLQGGSGPARAQEDLPAVPLVQTGPPGEAERERHGGAVRSRPAPADAEPGAARLGDWSQRRLPAPAALAQGSALAPAPALVAPALRTAPAPSLAALAPARSEAIEPLAAAAAPAALGLPGPLPVVQPLQALAERSLAAAPLAEAPAAVSALRPLLAEPAAGLASPVAASLPGLPALAEAPSPRLAADSALEQALQPVAAAPQALPPAAAAVLPESLGTALPSLPGLAPLDPAVTAGPAARPGAPDAGASVGADVATAPSAPASAPALNLNLPRPRAGELSRLGSAGLLPVLPRPPEPKTRLEEAVEGAARPDCRNAHARMGLLAVVPLAVDTVRGEGGCKW